MVPAELEKGKLVMESIVISFVHYREEKCKNVSKRRKKREIETIMSKF